MRKPTDKEIKEMSGMLGTFEGSKKATIWKWRWLCTTTKKEIIQDEWPVCGFCEFYDYDCPACVLKHCYGYIENNRWITPPHEKVVNAYYKLSEGKITLKQFRITAKRMLKVIEEAKE